MNVNKSHKNDNLSQPDAQCSTDDIALKSFFLGPQAENALWFLDQVHSILMRWFRWRRERFPEDGHAISQSDQMTAEFLERQQNLDRLIHETLTRFEKEIPKFSPRYIGHMFSEVSLPALAGHLITLLHNPNNISSEASHVGSHFESEALEFLNEMIGFPLDACGHFTSGGTVANFEALVRARNRMYEWLATLSAYQKNSQSKLTLFQSAHCGHEYYLKIRGFAKEAQINEFHFSQNNPFLVSKNLSHLFSIEYEGPVLLVPAHAHYSWKKGASLIGLPAESIWSISLNESAHLCPRDLQQKVELARKKNRPILAVVSVAGTTELGNIDPIDEISTYLKSLESEGFYIWHHVDAAYGGYFCSLLRNAHQTPTHTHTLPQSIIKALYSLKEATSVTLDPHKLGYVPYSCGTFLCRSKIDYKFSETNAPYIQYSQKSDKGLYSLEGSRSAAGAVATWLTAKSIGFHNEGYGRLLTRTIEQRNQLFLRLDKQPSPVRVLPYGDTNVLCFHLAKSEESLTESNRMTKEFIKYLEDRHESGFFVSHTKILFETSAKYLNPFTKSWKAQLDDVELILVRLCLMNPFLTSKNTKTNFYLEFEKLIDIFLKNKNLT